MKTKYDIVSQLQIGNQVAEQESGFLANYFVQTESFKKIVRGDVDVVYGGKGSGKSAIYQLINSLEDDFFDRRIFLISGEEVRGEPAFSAVKNNPPTTEEEFVGLWKLYILVLLARKLKEYGVENLPAQTVYSKLEQAKLLEPSMTLVRLVKRCSDYVFNRLRLTMIVDNVTTTISFSEPSENQREQGAISIDELINYGNQSLKEANISAWIMFDRLDVAFPDDTTLEANALRALFRVYISFLSRENIKLKIFLRDDIWEKIIEGGFRERSHITKVVTLSWDDQSLLNLLMKRVISNQPLLDFYNIRADEILADINAQKDLFYKIFPRQIEVGTKKPDTFEWALGRTRDGKRKNFPRELIHFYLEVIQSQTRLFENGEIDLQGDNLFGRKAFRNAVEPVSSVKLNTICSEYPSLKNYIEALKEKKTNQTVTSLTSIWKAPSESVLERANQLCDIGFFEKRNSDDQEINYWVPHIFRPALSMVQGSAD